MKTVAIIPARGGSKGIPRKNLQLVGGIPLVGRTIMAARDAKLVDAVYVSTEDAEIADVARQFGAEVIDRPVALATDEASSEAVLLHALDWLKVNGEEPDILVMLQCTSPFTTPDDIDRLVEPILHEEEVAAFTATHWHGFLWSEHGPINHDGGLRKRRQDLPLEYLETGAGYAIRVDVFQVTKNRFYSGGQRITVLPPGRSFEIDTPWDLELAQIIAARESGGEIIIHNERLSYKQFARMKEALNDA